MSVGGTTMPAVQISVGEDIWLGRKHRSTFGNGA